MKKVLYIITHNDSGGAQDAISKINSLKLENCTTELLALYSVNKSSSIKSLTHSEIPIFRNILCVFLLIKHLYKKKPDIVLSFLPFANVINGILSVFFKHKSIVSHRNPVWTYSFSMRIIDRFLTYFSIYDHIICNSISVKDSIIKYNGLEESKISIVNNFTENVDGLYSKDEIENILGFKLDGKFALAVGRLSQQKRFDILLDAFDKLDYQLIIAGDGELHDFYQNKIKQNSKIRMIGHVDNKIVKSLLKLSHLYLQPSEYEGQSNSLLEAIQFNCIIISSDIPPQREVLFHNNTTGGVLINSFDAEKWKCVISHHMAADDNEFLDNVKIIRSLYSPLIAKKKIEKIFEYLFL